MPSQDKNPWWQVDLGSSVDVTKVKIYNRQDCCQSRLSGATIQLLDEDDTILGQHQLSNDVNWSSRTFPLSDFEQYHHSYRHFCQNAQCSTDSENNGLIVRPLLYVFNPLSLMSNVLLIHTSSGRIPTERISV